MQPEFAERHAQLVRATALMPPTIQDVLRRLMLDNYTGSVQLNFKNGKILGWHENKVGHVPANELK